MVAWTMMGNNRGGETSGEILGGFFFFLGRGNRIY